jgi:hypothetical protein
MDNTTNERDCKGQKPQPTALRLIKGNPGKRPLPASELMPTGRATPPTLLDGRPADLGAALIEPAWWLTSADSQKAFMWCHLAAEFEADPPAMVASRIAQLRALGSELGFDPAARARLGAAAEPPADNPIAVYFSA